MYSSNWLTRKCNKYKESFVSFPAVLFWLNILTCLGLRGHDIPSICFLYLCQVVFHLRHLFVGFLVGKSIIFLKTEDIVFICGRCFPPVSMRQRYIFIRISSINYQSSIVILFCKSVTVFVIYHSFHKIWFFHYIYSSTWKKSTLVPPCSISTTVLFFGQVIFVIIHEYCSCRRLIRRNRRWIHFCIFSDKIMLSPIK